MAGCAKGVLKIGFVGRLSEQKGAEYLIDAMGILAERGVNARCFLVGDGELEGELRERVRRSAAVNDIVFLGRRDDPRTSFHRLIYVPCRRFGRDCPLFCLRR